MKNSENSTYKVPSVANWKSVVGYMKLLEFWYGPTDFKYRKVLKGLIKQNDSSLCYIVKNQ